MSGLHNRIGVLGGVLILGIGSAIAAACGEQPEVRTYSVAREALPEEAASDPVAATDTPAAPAGAAPWSAPEGWREVPGERPMRLATYEAGEGGQTLEVAISRFPGDVGGLLANVNRWRGQVGLGPTDEAALEPLLTPFSNPGFDGYTLRIEGPEQHMLAAIIHEPAADRTWFVKATAVPAVADAHEAEVNAFARSFGADRNSR